MNRPKQKQNIRRRMAGRISAVTEVQGIALAAVLLLLLVITLVGTVSLRMSKEQQTMSLSLKQLTRAQFAAEQAVREAIDLQIWNFDPDPTLIDWRHVGPNGTAGGTGTDYSYFYTIEHKIARGAVVTNDDGFPYYVIRSQGVSGNGRRQLEVAVVRLYDSYSIVEDAFIGCEGIPFNANGDLRSYNSNDAIFTEGEAAVAKTLVVDGDIVIDSSTIIGGDVKATGDITVSGNAILLKDAYANGNILVSNTARIEGSAWAKGTVTTQNSGFIDGGLSGGGQTDDQVETQDCDPLDIDAYIASEAGHISTPNPGGVPSVYNPLIDPPGPLGPGDYYFDSFNLSNPVNKVTLAAGDHVWYIDGPLTLNSGTGIAFEPGANLKIYITGQLATDSNSFFGADPAHPDPLYRDLHNTVQKPVNLQIFSSAVNATDNTPPDTNAMVNLQSNTAFMGVIYAPLAVVVFNSNNDSYGAVRGRWSHLDSNGDFWYDESLADETTFDFTEDLGYKIVYWTEQSYDSYDTINTSTVATSSSTSSTTATATTVTSTTTTTTTNTSVEPSTTAAPPSTTLSGPTFNYTNAACASNFSFDLNNISGASCALTQIEFTNWPSGPTGPVADDKNGRLISVSIGNTEVATDPGTHRSKYYPTTFISATRGLNWTDPDDPAFLFTAGDSKRLSFGFNNSAQAGSYTMTLRFSPSGCQSLAVTKLCTD